MSEYVQCAAGFAADPSNMVVSMEIRLDGDTQVAVPVHRQGVPV